MPIDFFWLAYIGMNKLGFTRREVGQLYFGEWTGYFEAYKRQYNFEKGRGLYEIDPAEEPVSPLSVL